MSRNVLVAACVLLSNLVMVSQQPSAKHPFPAPATSAQEVDLLFSGASSDERILLTLNNNHPRPLTASLTAYTSEGAATTLPGVVLVPSESKIIELSPVLKAAGFGHRELGWLRVSYMGGFLGLGMQLTLYPPEATSGVDSPRSLSSDFTSGDRHAVAWLPSGGRGKLALTNSSSSALSGRLICGSLQEPFTLAASQTIIKRFSAEILRERSLSPRAMACDVTSNGTTAALRAAGTITGEKGYSAPIRFYDTASSTARSLTAPGLRTDVADTRGRTEYQSPGPATITPVLREATASHPAYSGAS